jgi:hypothetical protein
LAAQWTSPGQRWRLLAPGEAVVIEVASGLLRVRRTAARLRALPAGTPVVLLDHQPGGRRRAHRMAATGVITVERQYVALPSLRTAILVAEDCSDSLSWACRSLVATPPGITWAHPLVDAAVRIVRRRPQIASWLAAGRIVVGRTA